jgi:hypothetical protein
MPEDLRMVATGGAKRAAWLAIKGLPVPSEETRNVARDAASAHLAGLGMTGCIELRYTFTEADGYVPVMVTDEPVRWAS